MRNSTLLRGAALLALATGAGVSQAHAQAAPPAPTFTAAPQFRDAAGDFTFKVRGRFMYDVYTVDADFAGTANDQSYRRSGLRRARLGVEGQMTPKFRYQAEATFLGGSATWEDLRLEYVGKDASVFIGQTNAFEPLEEFTSSRFISFNERAKWTEAFGTGRFAGIGFVTNGPNWSVRGALQGDNINTAETANRDEQYQIKGRVTWAPIMDRTPEGANVLHLGANIRYRDVGDDRPSGVDTAGRTGFRYRARPQGDGFGDRFIDTDYNAAAGLPAFSGKADTLYVGEAAFVRGPLMLMGQYAYADVEPVLGSSDVSFSGGNFDAVFNITGESHNYNGRNGVFNRVSVAKPITAEGGTGLWQIGARYDNISLTDSITGGKVRGGTQASYVVGLNWFPIDYVGFKLNYAYNDISGGDAGTRTGDANVISLRTQFDF